MSCSMCHISRVQKGGSWIKSSINRNPESFKWRMAGGDVSLSQKDSGDHHLCEM